MLTAVEAGQLATDDAGQLTFAAQQGRTIFTYNVAHFHALHTGWMGQDRTHAGIILVAQSQFTIGEQLRRALKLATALSANEMRNGLSS